MKRQLLLVLMAGMIWSNNLGAEETLPPVYQFPDISSEYSLWGGFTYVNPDGSKQAGEYQYLESSPSGGGSFMVFPGNSYLYFEGEILNQNDYFGDGRYSYQEHLSARWITRRLFHNLENIELRNSSDNGSPEGIDILDGTTEYGLKTDINQLSLRLKPSSFPFHIYAEGFGIDRDGNRQYQFLGGSGYFNDLQRTSIERGVNEQTRDYTLGFNAHLGPVEFDFKHEILNYDSGDDSVTYYHFSSAGLRPAGEYETGMVPDIKGFSDTLRLHSNYGGRFFTGATLSRFERTNEFSDVRAEYYLFNGELFWMPIAPLSLTTKFRWQDTTVKPSDEGSDLPAYNDSDITRFSLLGRYRFRQAGTLIAEFRHESHDRQAEYAREWGLAEEVDRNTYRLGFDTRLHQTLKVKVDYIHQDIHEDTRYLALGITPNSSDKVCFRMNWTPWSRFSAQFQAETAQQHKDDLQMLDEAGQPVAQELDRDVLSQRIFSSLNWRLNEKVWLTPSYTYFKNRVEQDLVYNTWPPAEPAIDDQFTSTDDAHVAAFNILYSPKSNLEIEALASYAWSRGRFEPMRQEAREPYSIATLSKLDIEEWSLEGRFKYEFDQQLTLRCKYRYAHYADDSPINPESGNYHVFQITLGKEW